MKKIKIQSQSIKNKKREKKKVGTKGMISKDMIVEYCVVYF